GCILELFFYVLISTSTKFKTFPKLTVPLQPMTHTDTIVAMATPAGAGAIAVLRLSGPQAVTIASSIFRSVSGKELAKQKTHTVHLGHIKDGEKILDEVLATIFKNPNSYTGEDVVEISCH